MKIDTVLLQTEATVSDAALKKMAGEGKHNTYHGVRDYSCYLYRIDGDPRQPLIKYTVENKKLTVLVPSLPRLVTGSCMNPLNEGQRDQVYQALTQCLGSVGIEAGNPAHWQINRLDVYHDFQVGEHNIKDYLDALSKVSLPRYETHHYSGTVEYRSGSKRHYSYNKHKKCVDEDNSSVEIEQSKGVLRYEVQYSGAELKSNRRTRTRRFEEVLSDEVTGNLIEKYFRTIPAANLTIATASDIQHVLANEYGSSTAIRLMGFIYAYARRQLDGLSAETVYRSLRQIQQAGVAPVIGTRQLEPLVLPFGTQQPNESELHDDAVIGLSSTPVASENDLERYFSDNEVI